MKYQVGVIAGDGIGPEVVAEAQKVLNCVALTIAIIGAINWGLIGFFDFNLVSGIFGDATAFTRVIYALVGLSGLYMISLYGRACADA